METKVLKSVFAVVLLILGMFVGLISFDNEVVNEATADTLYVYPGGAADGNYSTIQDAIDNAEEGDTIRVFEGGYSGNLIVNKSVSLIGNLTFGEKEVSAIVVIGTGDVVNVNASNVTIKGFYIYYAGTNVNESGIKINNVANCTITSCAFVNNSIGIWLNNSNNCTITGNYFDNNNISIRAESSEDDKIIDNYIINSTTYDIEVVSGELKVVNCSVNSSKLGTIGSSKIIIQEYFYVIAGAAMGFGEGPGIADAKIEVFENGTELKVFEGYTSFEGYIFPVPLTVYTYEYDG
jgi:parallel beta-helix repeat protein